MNNMIWCPISHLEVPIFPDHASLLCNSAVWELPLIMIQAVRSHYCSNTAYWSTIGSIYFSIKIVSPVRIFGNLGCFSTLITVPTCKVISVHMSFEHCKGLVPGLYVDILKVFCTAGSQCNSLFLTTADCCSKEKVFSPVFWQIFQLFEHFKPNFEIILVPP